MTFGKAWRRMGDVLFCIGLLVFLGLLRVGIGVYDFLRGGRA